MTAQARPSEASPPRTSAVAIAHDYLTQRGGAERVVVAIQRAFPGAAIHTSVYDPDGTYAELRRSTVVTTRLQRIGAFRRNPRLALPVLAPAMSRLRVDAEVTVCSTTGWAHGVNALGARVLYVHNTARWLYQRDEYLDGLPAAYRLGLAPLAPWLRHWDRDAGASAELVLVNSGVTRARVRRHWGRDAIVLHPPPGLGLEGPREPVEGLEPGFLLTVARLMPYKRVDIVLEAVAATGSPLVVVGDGPERERLARLAPRSTRFVTRADDAQLRWLYANAEALVTAAHDDFGLTPLEAMQFGTPVVAVREGGFPETVVAGETGVLFDGATSNSVQRGLEDLRTVSWNRARVAERAAEFSEATFARRLREAVAEVARTRSPGPSG
ncbi:MAG TPA: glycosyltransferase [Acidimicrobiales bacterium]|nr:glycosyltransferase [Acidimicrobiales bacterium]